MTSLLALAALLNQEPSTVRFAIEGRGSFDIKIDSGQAPKLAAHFLDLVDEKFYDGILFHRKVPNFVLQTGDPVSKKFTPEWAKMRPGESGGTIGLGDGGSGKSVPFEINDLVHSKFTVGMALESPMDDSGDSQFFINLKDNFRLNGMYCVFGRVVKGQDVVESCERGDRIRSAKRLSPES